MDSARLRQCKRTKAAWRMRPHAFAYAPRRSLVLARVRDLVSHEKVAVIASLAEEEVGILLSFPSGDRNYSTSVLSLAEADLSNMKYGRSMSKAVSEKQRCLEVSGKTSNLPSSSDSHILLLWRLPSHQVLRGMCRRPPSALPHSFAPTSSIAQPALDAVVPAVRRQVSEAGTRDIAEVIVVAGWTTVRHCQDIPRYAFR